MPRLNKNRKRWIPLLIPALFLGACASPVHFVDPDADLAYYEVVGVMPLTAWGDDPVGGYKMTNLFFTELLRSGFAKVAEPGQFAAVSSRIRPGVALDQPWSTADLARLGTEAGVQGLFMGSVRDFRLEREGRDAYPLVSCELRLVDTATGRMVWSASKTQRGGPGFPLLNLGEIQTLGELGSAVCRELLRTLPEGRTE